MILEVPTKMSTKTKTQMRLQTKMNTPTKTNMKTHTTATWTVHGMMTVTAQTNRTRDVQRKKKMCTKETEEPPTKTHTTRSEKTAMHMDRRWGILADMVVQRGSAVMAVRMCWHIVRGMVVNAMGTIQ